VKWVLQRKKILRKKFQKQKLWWPGDAAELGPRVKNPALQKIIGEYLSFQGGDSRPWV
jgi:hypothetical protein